jgi:hypothetical protein
MTQQHTRIVCTTTAGLGGSHYWVVQVGTLSTTPSTTTSYALPAIQSVTAPSLSTAGGQSITVVGTGLGPVAEQALVRVRYGPATDQTKYSAVCTVGASSNGVATSLTCTSAPGVGAAFTFLVRKRMSTAMARPKCCCYRAFMLATTKGPGGGRGDLTCAVMLAVVQVSTDNVSGAGYQSSIAYTAPAVTSMTASASTLNTDGTHTLRFVGTNFGPVGDGPLYLLAGSYRSTGRPCSVVVAHTTMDCPAVGVGVNVAVNVEVAGQAATGNQFLVTFRVPSILDVSGSSVTAGGNTVRLFGIGFGPTDGSNVVTATYVSRTSSLAGLTYNARSCQVRSLSLTRHQFRL